MKKSTESLAVLQVNVRNATRNLINSQRKLHAAQVAEDRAQSNYKKALKELDDGYLSVKNASRV